MKRWIALLLVLALLPIPGVFAAGREEAPRLITEEDYAAVDRMWQVLEEAEGKAVRSNRNIVEAAATVVRGNDLYKEGTLRWQGEDHFTFETTVGVTCAYSTRIRELAEQVKPYEGESVAEYQTLSYANTATAKDVYVLQPYYGIDSSFTTQYQTEGQYIADAMGGTCHLYTKTAVTVDVVADAIEKGAVVIFDSHGDTDYAKGEDYTTGATTSYLLLQTGSGLTDADYADDNGTYHAIYYGKYMNMYYYAVDGTCISNHMEGTAPNSLLWMAICLSMATDGLHKPLMEQGVAVAYGYSQSVTFGGDYCWEGKFWDDMCDGTQVKDAVAAMKQKYGCWDYSPEIYAANGWARDSYYCGTLAQAQQKRAAFPIVVSAEDTYPGHGKVDNLQTVYSSWVLPIGDAFPTYVLTSQSNDESLGTVTQVGNVITASPKENAYVSGWSLNPEGAAQVTVEGTSFVVTQLTADCCLTVEFSRKPVAVVNFSVPEGCEKESVTAYVGDTIPLTAPVGTPVADAYAYEFRGWTLAPVADTTQAPAYLTDSYTVEAVEITLYALYSYVDNETVYYTTKPAVMECPSEAYVDVLKDVWYHNAVDYALRNGLMNGISADRFDPEGQLTRAMLTTILYRMSGQPEGGSHLFTDVPDGQWYSDAIAWAYTNQVVNGVDDYTFAPHEPVTRQQAATMLYRYARLLGADVTPEGNLSVFKDADQIADYAKLPLRWAVGEGIINGVGNGQLAPEGTATRAQIAKIIYEWLENS